MQTRIKQTRTKISETAQQLLRCPKCKSTLEDYSTQYQCTACNLFFPIVGSIPILIDEEQSIFSLDDFVHQRKTTFYSAQNTLKQTAKRLLPDISKNITGRKNYRRFTSLLLDQSSTPRVLIIGGSILGAGMEELAAHPDIELVESDVTFGPRVTIISDAHSIPFEDSSFDGVIVQAVLEHVVDPWKCVEEIHRVLKEGGLVYAETPFMQQVHMGRYDFTRFTHLGHRRLFRKFEEIANGAVCGPTMALLWSYQYFLLSFVTSSLLRKLIVVFVRLTTFFLTYLDYFLIDRPGTLDAASGYYFMGRKSNRILSDKDLIQLYRGLDQT